MYCKTCGAANSEESNYCYRDGTSLTGSSSLNRLQVVNKETNFCPLCGEGTSSRENYCGACGHTLFSLAKKESAAAAIESVVVPAKNYSFSLSSFFTNFTKDRFQKALLPAVAAFLLMIILSFFVSSSMNQYYDSLFEEVFEMSPKEMAETIAEETGAEIKAPGHLFGFTDVAMVSHLVPPTYTINAEGVLGYDEGSFNGKLKIDSSSIILLLLPFTSLFVAGILYRRYMNDQSFSHFLTAAVSIGAIYGIFLCVFSFFSGFSYDLKVSEGGDLFKASINTSYFFLAAFIKAALIGVFASLSGMLFSLDYRHITKHLEQLIPYGEAAHQGFSAFIRSFVLLAIIFIVIIGTKLNEWKENVLDLSYMMDLPLSSELLEKTWSFAAFIGTQLGALVYSMLHFTPLAFKMNLDSIGSDIEIHYAIFGGFQDSFGGMTQNLDVFFDMNNIGLYLKSAILIPIAFLLWAGYSLAKLKQTNWQTFVIFSLVYSVFTAVLAAASGTFLSGSVTAEGDFDTQQQALNYTIAVSSIRVLLLSFLMAGTLSFAGSWLYKFSSQKKRS
ncbi:zinc ribbon domain-containing protein [Bacillus sp. B190/17]|uniref:Zinc ribbon domain-containing protein n=1 Tax=Bacillus lumedeiriae TaxID=3058829 RepID=A0ABW8IBT0_9BACI